MRNSLTQYRKKILSFINNSNVPLSAKDIFNKFKEVMDQATVYRSLQFLETNSYIEGFTVTCSKDGTMRYYYKHETPHRHFFHCENCHSFLPINRCPTKNLNKIEEEYGLKINRHVLYFTGLCGECNEV